MHFDRDSGVTAVREPAGHLCRPPPSVVLPVVLREDEVELAQLREPRQDGPHLVPEEEVHKAGAVDPIGVGPQVIANLNYEIWQTGRHADCDR